MTLFISNNRKKYKYFNLLVQNTDKKSTVKRLGISFNLLRYFKEKDLKEILNKNIRHKFYEIDMKIKNPVFKSLYKAYIKLVTPLITSWTLKLIDRYEPKAVAVWNGQRFPENLITDIAKKKNLKTIYFEIGFFPNTTVVDPKGVNYQNSLPREIEFYENYPIKEDTFPKKINTRNHLIKRKLDYIDLPEKYIFVPFQTSFDTQIVYNSPWIKSMPMLFDIIYDIALKTKTVFVFKEHPHERDFTYEELHKKARQNPYVMFANANPTPELIKNSQAVITINSTVGLEAMLMEKRVIVLGNAFYALNKITKKANSIEKLEAVIKTIDEWKVPVDLIKRFLSFLINEYLVKGTWSNPDSKHYKAVEKRIKDIINDTYYDHFGKKRN